MRKEVHKLIDALDKLEITPERAVYLILNNNYLSEDEERELIEDRLGIRLDEELLDQFREEQTKSY